MTAKELDRGLLALSGWIDAGDGSDHWQAAAWHRIGKVAEESGEVVECLIGVLGQNRRKGQSHSWEDVEKELLDVAISALGALAHIHDNDPGYSPVAALEAALEVVLHRAGITTGGEGR